MILIAKIINKYIEIDIERKKYNFFPAEVARYDPD